MKFIEKFWSRYKFAVIAFLIWRTGSFIIGYWSIGLLRFNASFPFIDEILISSGLPQWLWQWGNFDGVHYLTIAKFGYNGIIGNEQVFFPLYPLLIRLFGGGFAPAILISNFFALAAGLLIFKHFGKWAVIFLFCFPTALFLGAVYTESLFIFLVLLTFYKSKYFGVLAGLTRLTGFFTGIFGIFGVGLYMLYLKVAFNNPLLFLFHQGGFRNGRANSVTGFVTPFQTVYRYFRIILTADPGNIAFWVSLSELLFFSLTIGLLAYLTLRTKQNKWLLLYSWAVVLVPSITGTLTSIPRYVMVIIPLYVFLAGISNRKLKLAIAAIFIIIQAVFTALFVRGYFIA